VTMWCGGRTSFGYNGLLEGRGGQATHHVTLERAGRAIQLEGGDLLAVFHGDDDAVVGGVRSGGANKAAVSRLLSNWVVVIFLSSVFASFVRYHCTAEEASRSLNHYRTWRDKFTQARECPRRPTKKGQDL